MHITAGSTGVYSICASQLSQGSTDRTTRCNRQIVGWDTKSYITELSLYWRGGMNSVSGRNIIKGNKTKTRQGSPLPYDSSWRRETFQDAKRINCWQDSQRQDFLAQRWWLFPNKHNPDENQSQSCTNRQPRERHSEKMFPRHGHEAGNRFAVTHISRCGRLALRDPHALSPAPSTHLLTVGRELTSMCPFWARRQEAVHTKRKHGQSSRRREPILQPWRPVFPIHLFWSTKEWEYGWTQLLPTWNKSGIRH